ncbi:MAG: phosphatase PAP2 family protein [Thioclava sp.]|nr:phosphatase PAP2 family protein [Thioclava sp.]MBD3804786.1 phosphatase PAP2 family protein [Thioclava sp.]
MNSWREHLRQRVGKFFRIHGIDGPLAVPIAFGAALLLAFVKLAEEVMEGATRVFDEAILLALSTPGDVAQPIGPVWLQESIRDFTALGSTDVLTIITLSVAAWLPFSEKRRTAGLAPVAVLGGIVFSGLLKIGFARTRPEIVLHPVAVSTNSFPSDHAMMSVVVSLTLGFLVSRTQHPVALKVYVLSLALFLTLLVGLCRIYLDVNWPSDVLAGWAVGACWALSGRDRRRHPSRAHRRSGRSRRSTGVQLRWRIPR